MGGPTVKAGSHFSRAARARARARARILIVASRASSSYVARYTLAVRLVSGVVHARA